jgi:hypothetical protein
MTVDVTMASQDIDAENAVRQWTVHGMCLYTLKHSSHLASVEVRLQPRATARFETIRARVFDWVHSFDRINLSSTLEGWEDVPELASSVEQVLVSESSCSSHSLHISEMALQIHVYQPADTDSYEEFTNTTGTRQDDDETMAATVCELPNRGMEGLWSSLIYADDIKMKLLDYIHATLVFSDANVDCAFQRPCRVPQCSDRCYSQPGILESCCFTSWASWNRQNFFMPRLGSKAFD